MLWLVTRSPYYYPAAGTGDWLLLTPDKDKARETFDKYAGAYEYTTHLIGLAADGSYSTLDVGYKVK